MARVWMRVRELTAAEKADIVARCERFLAEVLRPRFLPEIRPTEFNYPVALTGRWRGRSYSFVSRYRSGFADNRGEEFDAPFARLDHRPDLTAEMRFDVMWHRHTGRWHCLFEGVTLEEALRLIETEGLLQPV